MRPVQQPVEVPGGAPSGVGHVDVRIRTVAEEGVGVLDHLRCHVGVEVERSNDGCLATDQRTHPAQQLALAVLEVLGHHRPVQAEVHRVHGPRGSQAIENESRDVLVGVLGDVGAGRCRAPGGGEQTVPRTLRLLDEPGDREVHAPDSVRESRSGRQLRPLSALLELPERRERGCERVGFVLKAAYRDAGHSCFS